MITVNIIINGSVITSATAKNVGEVENGYHQYELDFDRSGEYTIVHERDNGAVELAILILEKLAEYEDR